MCVAVTLNSIGTIPTLALTAPGRQGFDLCPLPLYPHLTQYSFTGTSLFPGYSGGMNLKAVSDTTSFRKSSRLRSSKQDPDLSLTCASSLLLFSLCSILSRYFHQGACKKEGQLSQELGFAGMRSGI